MKASKPSLCILDNEVFKYFPFHIKGIHMLSSSDLETFFLTWENCSSILILLFFNTVLGQATIPQLTQKQTYSDPVYKIQVLGHIQNHLLIFITLKKECKT